MFGLTPFPPDHPGYAEEQRWMAKKVAAEMLREQGIVNLNDSRFDTLRADPRFQEIVRGLDNGGESATNGPAN